MPVFCPIGADMNRRPGFLTAGLALLLALAGPVLAADKMGDGKMDKMGGDHKMAGHTMSGHKMSRRRMSHKMTMRRRSKRHRMMSRMHHKMAPMTHKSGMGKMGNEKKSGKM
jgi:hypothetical protein